MKSTWEFWWELCDDFGKAQVRDPVKNLCEIQRRMCEARQKFSSRTSMIPLLHLASYRESPSSLTTEQMYRLLEVSNACASNLPFWLIEMRRRALGEAYSIDKLLCTFVGRPPRISQRYCTIVPPMDVEYSELLLDDSNLENTISNIDENGWRKSEKARKSVYQRCIVLSSMLREEILELSLGPFQENMMEKSR